MLGGSAPRGASDAVVRFDPVKDRIHPAGRLPHALTDAAVATIGGTVYLLGGISTGPTAAITVVHPR